MIQTHERITSVSPKRLATGRMHSWVEGYSWTKLPDMLKLAAQEFGLELNLEWRYTVPLKMRVEYTVVGEVSQLQRFASFILKLSKGLGSEGCHKNHQKLQLLVTRSR